MLYIVNQIKNSYICASKINQYHIIMHFKTSAILRSASKALLIAAIPFVMGSCTVSEPEAISGKGTSGRLQSISFLTQKIWYFNYDSQGRITEIGSPSSDLKITVSYDPLQLDIYEYEFTWSNDSESDRYMLVEHDTWSDITLNADGYITRCTSTERTYDRYSGSSQPTVDLGTTSFNYDSEGHLISTKVDDETSDIFTWENDCLTAYNNDEDEYVTYNYYDVENRTLQWTPFWGPTGPQSMTGLIGKAPSKMISSIITKNGGDDCDGKITFAYKFNSIGQISAMQMLEPEDNLTMTLTFSYK